MAKFDLALFRSLNDEYRDKPLVPSKPDRYAKETSAKRGLDRATKMTNDHNLAGKRVLEIGCGRGDASRAFAQLGCKAVGVDVAKYPQWDEAAAENPRLMQIDLTQSLPSDLGKFDFVYSSSVFEHIRHPYAMLKVCRDVLADDGRIYIRTNLFRGPKASHRYKEVFFPWPHLLFTDEVFEEFYRSIGAKPKRASWVNRLSIADYRIYFDMTGLQVDKISFSKTPIEEPFYRRFADVLERYPRYDLERDFMNVLLSRGTAKDRPY